MSKLLCSFDLHYDIKSTEALDQFIRQAVNPQEFMLLMLKEIQSRDRKIDELEEAAVMAEIVSKAHQELVGELMVPKKKHDTYCGRDIRDEKDQVFNDETAASFCRYCGASIPHRDGEGRCDKCMHHLPDFIPEFDTEVDTETHMYRNHYKCPCGNEWWDTWSSMCDDRCPKCNISCSPSDSTDINNDPWDK